MPVLLTSQDLWDLPVPPPTDPAFAGRLADMLDSLPRYLRTDPLIGRFAVALTLELGRIAYAAQLIRDSSIPYRATLGNGGLVRWEELFGLTPPPGSTESSRITVLQAHLAARDVSTTEKWYRALRLLSGAQQLSVTKTGRSVIVRIPGTAGAAGQAQMEQLLRRIVPAHLLVDVDFFSGFNVDESRVDYGVL